MTKTDRTVAVAAEAVPVSQRIRQRIEQAGKRFHANDNIAEFVRRRAELKALEDEVSAKMQEVLESLVIDTESDHNTRGTAHRVARMFLNEVFSGRYHRMPQVTEFPNAERLNELMIIGPITVRSACSHHLVPILGKLWIGHAAEREVQPDRLVEVLAHRRMDHEPAADPGGSGDPARRPAASAACGPTVWRSCSKPITSACTGAA